MNQQTASADKAALAKKVLSLSGKYAVWEVWSDFIMMFAIAISNAIKGPDAEGREQTYLKTIAKYTPAEQSVFLEMAAIVIMALEREPEQDFLGSVYMELNLGNHWKGQFFTPYNVCRLMAEITNSSSAEAIQKNGYISLNDCACGAGATLIAGVHAIGKALFKAKSPLNWQNHVLVTAQDIDHITGLMCYIQLSLLGCAGFVKIGDSITDPMRDGDDPSKYWYTPYYFSDVWHTRRLWSQVDVLLKKQSQQSII